MSIVRDNLMNQPGYSPYCGADTCRVTPRTVFDGKQFNCPCCGWRSGFEPELIAQYKLKWEKNK